MNIYTLTHQLSGPSYSAFLRHAVGICDKAILVVRNSMRLNLQGIEALHQLQPYLLEQTETSKWPGTELLGSTAFVFYYNFSPECEIVLERAVDALYSWLQPDLPEDLCLIRPDGHPYLVSISHEHYNYLNLTDSEKRSLEEALPWIGAMLALDA